MGYQQKHLHVMNDESFFLDVSQDRDLVFPFKTTKIERIPKKSTVDVRAIRLASQIGVTSTSLEQS
jgi:hypothetical protein